MNFKFQKIINPRPMVLAFISLLLGILISRFENGVLEISLGIVSLIFVILFFSLKSTKKFAIILSVLIILFLLGMISYNLTMDKYDSLKNYEDCFIVGDISNTRETESGNYVLLMENICVGEEKVDSKATIYFDTEIPVGSRVVFYGSLIKTEARGNNYATRNFRVNNFYKGNIKNILEIYDGDISVWAEVRNTVKEYLTSYSLESTAPIIYAMMFGDSKYIDGETIEEFRSTGLAHIFAVSGLHIGVLAAALVFLLNLLRANKWVKFFVIFTILTLYATICEFSPSVLRASIMFLCYLLADIFGRKKDRLSIMCFAAILILIINPLAFFEISFQMSFGAIFGIILFADYFKRKLNFLPDWISSSVALSLSVNITLLPLMLYYFGYVSMVFIFVNLILLPFISLLYILALLTTILGLLVPYLHYLTLIVSYLMELAIWGNSLFVNLTITGLEFKIGLAVVILYYIVTIISSRFVLCDKKTKIGINSVLSATIGLLLICV